jgi:hypothetical protein
MYIKSKNYTEIEKAYLKMTSSQESPIEESEILDEEVRKMTGSVAIELIRKAMENAEDSNKETLGLLYFAFLDFVDKDEIISSRLSKKLKKLAMDLSVNVEDVEGDCSIRKVSSSAKTSATKRKVLVDDGYEESCGKDHK